MTAVCILPMLTAAQSRAEPISIEVLASALLEFDEVVAAIVVEKTCELLGISIPDLAEAALGRRATMQGRTRGAVYAAAGAALTAADVHQDLEELDVLDAFAAPSARSPRSNLEDEGASLERLRDLAIAVAAVLAR